MKQTALYFFEHLLQGAMNLTCRL